MREADVARAPEHGQTAARISSTITPPLPLHAGQGPKGGTPGGLGQQGGGLAKPSALNFLH